MAGLVPLFLSYRWNPVRHFFCAGEKMVSWRSITRKVDGATPQKVAICFRGHDKPRLMGSGDRHLLSPRCRSKVILSFPCRLLVCFPCFSMTTKNVISPGVLTGSRCHRGSLEGRRGGWKNTHRPFSWVVVLNLQKEACTNGHGKTTSMIPLIIFVLVNLVGLLWHQHGGDPFFTLNFCGQSYSEDVYPALI